MKYYITWLDADSGVIADTVVEAATLIECMNGIIQIMQGAQTRPDIKEAVQISFNREPL